jgi:GT2 family glycosyltransferase
MAAPGCDLYWRGKALEYALAGGLPDLAAEAAAPLAADPAAGPLFPRLAAEIAATFAGPEAVLKHLDQVDTALFPRFAALARGHGLLETGADRQGAAELRRLWRQEPWHPGLTLRLHEVCFPTPPLAVADWPGRVFVWLYTWNRAAKLERTLDRLAASRLGPAKVVVLDNGATDDTRAVCRTMEARFAPGRFETVSLPVNIGAPAARNWLAATAGLGPDDLGAYLDDDALVPPGWLEALAGALMADAGADVAGPRILARDTAVPLSADVRLLPPERGHTVRPLVNCPLGPDYGLLAATRPCASVSGCCHAFRGRALAHPAPFDIRFSPSQFDDLARDLAAFLAGRRCVLAGAAAVAHHQPDTAGQMTPRTLGARVKLDGLFAAEAMARAAARDLDLAWEELDTKWKRLAQGRAMHRD